VAVDEIASMCAALGSDPEALRAWGLARADEIVRALPPDSTLAPLLVDAHVEGEEIEELEVEELEVEELDEVGEETETETAAPEQPDFEPVFQRRHERFALREQVQITIPSWSRLLDLQADDISQGGMFVRTEEPPARGERITVSITLPEGGTLELEGEVVHVVEARAGGPRPGFGVQFVGLTAERKSALRRLVRHAMSHSAIDGATAQTLHEFGFTPTASGTYRMSMTPEEQTLHEQLHARLSQMRRESDTEVLALPREYDESVLHDAYFKMAEVWHPDVAARHAAPEIKRLVVDIFLRVNEAYENLRRISRPEDRGTKVVAKALKLEPTGAPVLARRLASSLGQIRAQHQAIEPPRPSVTRPPPPKRKDPRITDAIDRMTNKDFQGAIRILEKVPLDAPGHRVLYEFAHARLALSEKDTDEACRRYRAILAIQPENATARRELLLIEAMQQASR
jgi:uncharacterized protein (TIGR02266 family)